VVALAGVRSLILTRSPAPGRAEPPSSSSVAAAPVSTSPSGSASVDTPSPVSTSIDSAPATSVRVVGNRLVDLYGHTLRLLGVDRSGTEYMCTSGGGIFDGPSDPASVAAIASWHVNAVRIPLNEDCWLDHRAALDPYNPAFTGANYRDAIVNYVKLLHQNGMYAILDLHWNGCGRSTCLANWMKELPDRPNADLFWASVATTFKNDHAVLFDLFNEPFGSVNWSCWRDGGCVLYGGGAEQYVAAGMQEMLDAVRATGATQPVLIGGLGYANDVSGWLSYRPRDPLGQVVLSVHAYNFATPCSTTACFSSGPYSLIPIARKVPVIFAEIGENDCSSRFVDQVMPWADINGFSYLAWAWDPYSCSKFPSLVTSYDGTPTAFGLGLKHHLGQLSTPGTASGGTAAGGSGPPTSRIQSAP